MNTIGMAKHYSKLNVDERFRLILAAVNRGDDAEKNRLLNAGQRIQQTISDVVPYLHAFIDLQNSTYIELLALAAQYHDFNARTDKWRGEDIQVVRARNDGATREWTERQARGLGFVLKVRFDGWRLFCEGLQVSPWLMWEQPDLPGFHRITSAIVLANCGNAFPSATETASWMDEVQPLEVGNRTAANVKTPAGVAAELDADFRERIRFWGG